VRASRNYGNRLVWSWVVSGSVVQALAAWVFLLAIIKMIVHGHQPPRSIRWVD